MIAIAVDDEPLMLGALTKAIKASADITSVADFTSCEEALDFIKSNPADIAFLEGDALEISSTDVRSKKSTLVPSSVLEYMKTRGLYAGL